MNEEQKSAIDTLDLINDELVRIQVICPQNTVLPTSPIVCLSEIYGICERAIMDIKRNVSVIDELEKKNNSLRQVKLTVDSLPNHMQLTKEQHEEIVQLVKNNIG